ncbi:ABC transporter substrate-binding protein [Bifidobacterium sp. UTCIF-37]|uniref:ABC transporter substrate-binding protein n=1 Tax=unclassified Bifidobacterium TaxID=2608897 RepID=UPI000D143205|nr:MULTISPECIES: extracellular solute-binding protein [unclassified Bifidobacterium]PST47970.1 ABC transporter substrate-binding protein [Bifidobacterium callitrichos]TPF85546.1 ABC transporter substrate-binding protein [Bifidobacterium sp. UTCIF-37]TPF87640.1 ABC transporter substrate-binding protein [Bifidobacterium sp. UTCIF-38]
MKFNRTIKTALAAIAAGAMLIPLAACGGSADSGKIKLSYLSWNNEQMSKPYIDAFEKENPDIEIDFSYSPPTPEYIQTLQTRLVGNQAPDVFVITSENKTDLMDNGYVKDLTDEPFMKNISQANKDFVSRDGKVYGMSTSSWASGIVYNKDLLKKVGVDEVPGTWDEFLALCKKLKNAGITPYLETVADGLSRIPDSFQGSIFAKEGTDITKLATESKQTPGENEKEAVKAWMKLYDQDLVTRDTVGISGDDMKTQFVNGQVAMICTGPWDFGTFQEASGLNWGYAQMPALDKDHENYAQGSPSPGLAIYSKLEGDKLKAAEKFLTFMSSKTALDMDSKNGNAVTVEGYNSSVIDQFKDVYEKNVQTGKYFLMTNFYKNPDVLSTATQAETQQLVQGQITVDQWAKNVDEKMASAQ